MVKRRFLMERTVEKRYTTGEFADYFQVKKDTLLYYDRIGLFCPAGVSDNGYRFYTSSQIDQLWTILTLRELDVPIRTLQAYFHNPSPRQLLDMTESQLMNIDGQIKKLQKIKRSLSRVKDVTHEAETAVLGQVLLKMLPAKRLLYSREFMAGDETALEEWSDIYNEFAVQAGLTGADYVGSVIAKDDLDKEKFKRVDRLFVECGGHRGRVRRGGLYAVYYYKGAYDGIPEIYPQIVYEILRLGYSIKGDAYEKYLIAETATNVKEEFVTKIELQIGE